ncbi:hypothetical protein INT48_007021 [Thamnidium elegans]|uniref:Enoyl reductase (ER) domain-containing protein n=1 Tax=Thamnidium elegans TaxID=101142 RepID=A0A8H7VSC5_9FUNG|nr:hypothetical protein INT48_007021 [Thamnidium elegans]
MTIDTPSNLSAVLYGPGILCMEQTPIDEPKENEVQINVRATGICGSDLHYYHQGRIGTHVLDSAKPMILGHESAGIITKVGSNVDTLAIGDRVVIEPGKACLNCNRCNEGRYNLCLTMEFSSSLLRGPNQGLLREFVCFPAYLCHRMPDSMTYEQGALVEPLAVAVHSVGRTRTVKKGSCVAIIGAGPIGLLVAATVYAQGASKCILFDINESRLDFSKTYLPRIETVMLPKKSCESSILEWAQDHVQNTLIGCIEPETIDAVFECTGVETSVGLSMYLVRRGGVVMLIGLGSSQCLMPIDLISTREIDVLGNFRYSNVHRQAITMISENKIPTDGLVSHKFSLDQTLSAFELLKKGGENVIKVQIGDF